MARFETPGPTREVFVPPTFGTEQRLLGDYVGYRIDADLEYAGILLRVPHDFKSIVAMEVVWVAEAAVTNMLLRILTSFAGPGEAYQTHTGSVDVTQTTSLTYIYATSISGAFTALAALDTVGIRVQRPTGGNANATILGIRIRYR